MMHRLRPCPERGCSSNMYNIRILNPHLLSLLARVRHTNTLVIADRGFPHFPQLETIDISLVDDSPTVLQVLAAIRPEFRVGNVFMAREFVEQNTPATQARFATALGRTPLTYEPHADLKRRVSGAIGVIRTGDTIQYANLILVSGPSTQEQIFLNGAAGLIPQQVATIT